MTRPAEFPQTPLDADTLQTFLDQNPILAYVKDPEGRYLYINPQMASVLGATQAEVTGTTAERWLPTHVVETSRAQEAHVLARGGFAETTQPVRRADGREEWWRIIRFAFGPAERRFIGGVALDVTEIEHARRQLAASEQRYRNLVELGEGLICTHDLDGTLRMMNPAALRILGVPAEQVIGRNLGELLLPEVRARVPRYLERLRHVGFDAGVVPIRGADGRREWQYRNIVIREPGQPPYVLAHAHDITPLIDYRNQLAQLAMTDELTGLHNRRSLREQGARLLREARRRGTSLAVFYADLNGLKRVNDGWGHEAGSALIVQTARILQNAFRAADIVARAGGDEFVGVAIVPPHYTRTVLERIRQQIDAFNATSRLEYALGVSIAVHLSEPGGQETFESLLQRADQLMYAQKQAGREERDRRGEGPTTA